MFLKCFVNDSEMLFNNFEKLSNDFEMLILFDMFVVECSSCPLSGREMGQGLPRMLRRPPLNFRGASVNCRTRTVEHDVKQWEDERNTESICRRCNASNLKSDRECNVM